MIRLASPKSAPIHLSHYHTSGLRKAFNISLPGMAPNAEILKREGTQNEYTLMKLTQLRSTDHGTKLSDKQLPKKNNILSWQNSDG